MNALLNGEAYYLLTCEQIFEVSGRESHVRQCPGWDLVRGG